MSHVSSSVAGPALEHDALEARAGLPDAFRYLEAAYPRSEWPVLDLHPMALHWLEIHDWFRGQMQDLADLGDLWRNGQADDRQYRAAATPRVRHLITNLHHHHELESTQAFPQLIAAEPSMAKGFALLDRDHDAIEALLSSMAQAGAELTQAGSGSDDLAPLGEALSGQVERGTALIRRHLLDEEEIVVPVLSLRG